LLFANLLIQILMRPVLLFGHIHRVLFDAGGLFDQKVLQVSEAEILALMNWAICQPLMIGR